MSKGDKHIKRFHDFCINKTNVPADCVLENKKKILYHSTSLEMAKTVVECIYSTTAPKNIKRNGEYKDLDLKKTCN